MKRSRGLALVAVGVLAVVWYGRRRRRGVVVVKLGGAAITRKAARHTLNDEALAQCVDALVKYWRQQKGTMVVIHGAGSFGHFEAKEFEVGTLRHELGFAKTRAAVTSLNKRVVDAFIERDVPAVAVSPFSATDLVGTLDQVARAGLLPVTHGDVLLGGKYATILSGDEIATTISTDRVLFVTDVPGVYDRDPKTGAGIILPVLTPADDERFFGLGKKERRRRRKRQTTPKRRRQEAEAEEDDDATGGKEEEGTGRPPEVVDVTGGMTSKLKSAFAIAKRGIPVRILDPPSLEAALFATNRRDFITHVGGTLILNK